jgi:phosphohistidine phosphatase
MRTLLIMRHGKSSWKDAELPDMARPLKKRGRKDSKNMGELLEEKEQLPDVILCSTAERARQTAEIIAHKLDSEDEVEYLDELYMAEADTIVKILQSRFQKEKVMIIGHNPGLESLVQTLTEKIVTLPTGAIARIKLPIDTWQELGADTKGELANLWLPRD